MHNIHPLFLPYQLGRLQLKNRFVMTPMNTNYSSEMGAVTAQMEAYYLRRAQGGVGLIELEAVSVSRSSRNHGVQPMLCDEASIPAWSNLIERLQRYGTKVSIEIAHFGSEAVLPPRIAPSAVSRFPGSDIHVMTEDDINRVQEEFAQSVYYAKLAGADAVTLHGAHGYLIAEFLSPLYNHREDEYGGSLENRVRFLLETIQACRSKVGKTYPILVRLSVNEFCKGGRDLDESVKLAQILEMHGVDGIGLSAGIPATYLFTNPPHSIGETDKFLADYARQVTRAVEIPVICANGIRSLEDAEFMLDSGACDLVGLARTVLADADFPLKCQEGRAQEIRPCISCQYCFKTLDSGRSLRCAVNPETGREYQHYFRSATTHPKRIDVVGGGPAGMEAARRLALKGHNVRLFEAKHQLGGALRAAIIPPKKDKLERLVVWFDNEMRRLNVEVHLNTVYAENEYKVGRPDYVFDATGATYLRRIPGSDGPHVLNAVQALLDPGLVGKRVIIVGGGATGAELAEYLTAGKYVLHYTGADRVDGRVNYWVEQVGEGKPHDVTLVEMLDQICEDLDEFNRFIMLDTLKEYGVTIRTESMVQSIVQDKVKIRCMRTDKVDELTMDTLILAGGLTPSKCDLSFVNVPVWCVGDRAKPGRIADALYDAMERSFQVE